MVEAARQGLRFLDDTQNADGGWPFAPGEPSDLFATALLDWNYFVDWLTARQFSDGGWGEAATYEVRRYDGVYVRPGQPQSIWTALVLMALTSAGQDTSAAGRGGVAYLLRTQHGDGGWGIEASGPSETDCTTLAVSALARLPERSAIVEAGVRWLLAMQNADGGWGWPNVGKREPSTVESTARKCLGLLDAQWPQRAVLGAARTYLLEAQNPDCGWGYRPGDGRSVPYVTAGVCAALVRLE